MLFNRLCVPFSRVIQAKFTKRRFHLSQLATQKRQKEIDRSILSVLDMYSIGVGPSSSHTVGPMRAAYSYTKRLQEKKLIDSVRAIRTQLYGSLALTGEGHGTPKAILMGLEGNLPESIDPTMIIPRVCDIRAKKELNLAGFHKTYFDNDMLQLLKSEVLPYHSNGILFSALGDNKEVIDSEIYYSTGGGFVVTGDEVKNPLKRSSRSEPPFMFHTGEDLMSLCKKTNQSISQLQLLNEISFGKTEIEITSALIKIWNVMNECIERGLNSKERILPGGLNVRRRAPEIYQRLQNHAIATSRTQENPTPKSNTDRFLSSDMDWLSVYAMAVNEENAAGGRVVTAPTNGAAGVIPAVLRYYIQCISPLSEQSIVEYLMTAGTIGILFKKGASISAAEVGCQGEIGVACSMAAAGLCALYGGTPSQIANAAEIGMEHHLGMTCDPIGGLVQIPCIERNTMGSIKAVNAAHLALLGDGNNVVSLDTVIATMMKTGYDMQTTYKETSLGGLAVHIGNTEC